MNASFDFFDYIGKSLLVTREDFNPVSTASFITELTGRPVNDFDIRSGRELAMSFVADQSAERSTQVMAAILPTLGYNFLDECVRTSQGLVVPETAILAQTTTDDPKHQPLVSLHFWLMTVQVALITTMLAQEKVNDQYLRLSKLFAHALPLGSLREWPERWVVFVA